LAWRPPRVSGTRRSPTASYEPATGVCLSTVRRPKSTRSQYLGTAAERTQSPRTHATRTSSSPTSSSRPRSRLTSVGPKFCPKLCSKLLGHVCCSSS
jgi:hypothetical protein